ncbi:MAG: undecaprenyl-diphosphate phosphatase [Gemmatimonadota bacterium]
MTAIEAAVLGLVQGLTEFLPVSSSGHLVIGQTLFDLRGDHLAFDILVHGATLLAILVHFRSRLVELLRRSEWSYIGKLGVATVPAVIAGVTFYGTVREAFTRPSLVAGFLAITGGLLLSLYLRRRPDDEAGLLEPGWGTALLIGLFQACALLPGISRSGSTIVAGIWLGLAPAAAAEFSFLMAIPAIAGAIVYESGALGQLAGAGMADVFSIGVVFAFASALVAIRVVFRTIGRREFRWLGFYCLAIAALFGMWLAGGAG